MKRAAGFWDRVAERYSKRRIPDEAAYRRKLEIARSYFRGDMRVLEIGCGTGSTAIAHAPYVKHVRATDISSKMLEIAARRAAEAGVDNITFEQCAFDELAIEDESVDAVLALSVLHLLEDRDAAIAAIYRMLEPGGILVSNTICLGDGLEFFRYIGPVGRALGLLPLFRVFSAAGLRDSLTASGFEIDYDWQPNKRVAFIVARKPVRPPCGACEA